jgi:hypothetical protein
MGATNLYLTLNVLDLRPVSETGRCTVPSPIVVRKSMLPRMQKEVDSISLTAASAEGTQLRNELFLQLIFTFWTLNAVPSQDAEHAASLILDEIATLDERVG